MNKTYRARLFTPLSGDETYDDSVVRKERERVAGKWKNNRPESGTPDQLSGRKKELGGGGLDVQIAHFQGMFFDEFASWFDLVPHQDAEHIVGSGSIVHADLQ